MASDRLAVLQRLTLLLEQTTVTPITGVVMPANLSGLVFRGRRFVGEDAPPVMLSLLEAPAQPIPSHTADDQVRLDAWTLLLQGRCPDDKINPTDHAYSLLADVEPQLERINRKTGLGIPKYDDDFMLGGLITSFRVVTPVVSPPMEGVSSSAFFYIRLQVGFARIA